MNNITFEWDRKKNVSNQKKHAVSFEDAQTVFYDENARVIHDVKHSEHEERYIIIGYSSKAKLLIVCHCYRESSEIIRIISARHATKSESNQYHNFYKGN